MKNFNQSVQLFCIVCLLIVITSGFGVVTVFDSSATISSGDVYDEVLIKGDDTVVTMTGGTVNVVATTDSSQFILQNADIGTYPLLKAYHNSSMTIYANTSSIYSYGDSQILITGTSDVSEIYQYNNSEVRMTSNKAIVGYGALYHNSFLNVISGTIYTINAGHECHVEINGGIVQEMNSWASSPEIRIYDGTVDHIYFTNSSGSIVVNGGILNSIYVEPPYSENYGPFFPPVFAFVGHDLEATPFAGDDGTGIVAGF